MVEYKGYYIEETLRGFEIYPSYSSWAEGKDPLHIAHSLSEAESWIDQGAQLPTEQAVAALPFMPGTPIPGPISQAVYSNLDLVAPPISDYGSEVRSLMVDVVERMHKSPYFRVAEAFEETGWSSEDVIYSGKLVHVPSGTLWYAEMGVCFEWRRPETATKEDISLFTLVPDWLPEDQLGSYSDRWLGEMPLDPEPKEIDSFIRKFIASGTP